MNIDDHIGKQLLSVSIGIGFEPAIRVIADPGTDPKEIETRLRCAINEAITSVIGKFEWTFDIEPMPRVDINAKIIKTREERNAEHDALHDRVSSIFQAADDSRQKEIDSHPDNGKHGVWKVDGVRHDCRVIASSAREAVDKAVAADAVGDWESPTASYLGPVESMEVF